MDFSAFYSKGVEIYSTLNSSIRSAYATTSYNVINFFHEFTIEMNKPQIDNMMKGQHYGWGPAIGLLNIIVSKFSKKKEKLEKKVN